MRIRLEHARANVSDLGESIAWYTEVLGFEFDATWPQSLILTATSSASATMRPER